ncbi:MAG: FxDxF family PEP-CTERM protein [Methylotenera sp.]
MKNITKLFAVAIPLAVGLYSGAASAATETLTLQPSAGVPYASGTLVSGGNGPWTEIENSAFNDAYTFNFNFGPAASGAKLDIQYKDLNLAGHTFTSLTGALWQDNGALGVDPGDLFLGNIAAADVHNIFNYVANGNYYLNIAGVPDPLGGNGSTFGIHVQVTPVPEPETYAMMLGGLALVGFSARRRKTKQ